MPNRIGLFGPNERPLARTIGFKTEVVQIQDGDEDRLNVPSQTPSPSKPARDYDEQEY